MSDHGSRFSFVESYRIGNQNDQLFLGAYANENGKEICLWQEYLGETFDYEPEELAIIDDTDFTYLTIERVQKSSRKWFYCLYSRDGRLIFRSARDVDGIFTSSNSSLEKLIRFDDELKSKYGFGLAQVDFELQERPKYDQYVISPMTSITFAKQKSGTAWALVDVGAGYNQMSPVAFLDHWGDLEVQVLGDNVADFLRLIHYTKAFCFPINSRMLEGFIAHENWYGYESDQLQLIDDLIEAFQLNSPWLSNRELKQHLSSLEHYQTRIGAPKDWKLAG